jgi:pimeloyl-ACP methyl ester carboxylesterase
LPLAHALHRRGYQVLMFDLRNHGQSASGGPVSFGLLEANDLLGALDYLAARHDVDSDRLAAIGFSMGANAVLFALARTDRLKAAVAVQPTSPSVFGPRYAASVLGGLGRLVLPMAELLYRAAGGVRFSAVEPIFVASGAQDTPVLFVQGRGDPWGSVANVAQMAAQTPRATPPIYADSADRFDGYQVVVDHPEIAADFLAEHLH